MKTLALVSLTTLSLLAGVPAAAEELAGYSLINFSGVSVRWAGGGFAPVTIKYAVVTRPAHFPTAVNCRAIGPLDTLLQHSGISPSALHTEVRAAFALWEHAANIRFVETGNPEDAGILIGAQLEPDGRALTNVTEQAGNPGRIERSVICLNPEKGWKIGFDGNLDAYDLRYTFAHEIGHAIGLDHPPASHEVMSYKYGEGFRTLQQGDRSGAVALYGPAPSDVPAVASARGTAATLASPQAAAHN